MTAPDGRWVALFSGGKDSSFALYRALERGLDVGRLVTVHPEGDSYMYHVPATRLASLAAESVGVRLVDVEPGDLDGRGDLGDTGDPAACADVGRRGDAEVEPLEAALREVDDELARGIAGIVAGAVESEYQTSRIEGVCERLGVDLYAPLWRADPASLLEEMLTAGFEIVVVRVAAAGFDASWLGRRLDRAALADLRDLHAEYGVHVLGEGGEFETLVTDGPHMDRPIRIEYEPVWDGTRGRLEITDARLEGSRSGDE